MKTVYVSWSWSCSYIINDVLMWRWKKPPVDPKIHRVDIAYDISLNVEYVHTFGIRLPNIRGKYWRQEFKNFYRESRLYLAPSEISNPPPPRHHHLFRGRKLILKLLKAYYFILGWTNTIISNILALRRMHL